MRRWGWPLLPTEDLPGGGPGYPLAGLGVRGGRSRDGQRHVLAGVFNGSPIPRNSPNTQLSNPHGVSFPLNTGVFAIAETANHVGIGRLGEGERRGPLPGRLQDRRLVRQLQLRRPAIRQRGRAARQSREQRDPGDVHHGDYAFYGGVDQTIWRSKDNTNRNINVFIRPMFTPLQDRNLISFSVNGGLDPARTVAGRGDDTFGARHGRRAGQQQRIRLR